MAIRCLQGYQGTETSVLVPSFNKPGSGGFGGFINIEWHKGKGVNKFVIDGATYDKVARDVPLFIPKAGFHDIQIGDEYIRPQVSEQFDRLFLIDRSGSFIHDVIAQASRLSVLLRADRACGADLKRQKAYQKIRVADLGAARTRLETMLPITELHARIQTLKPKLNSLRSLSNRLEDIREMGLSRSKLKPITTLQVPVSIPAPHYFRVANVLLELRKLREERHRYTHLPENVPSAKKYDFDGMVKLASNLETAKKLAEERTGVLKQLRLDQQAHKSVKQELEMCEAELGLLLGQIEICPVCNRPMPGKEAHEVHSSQ